VMNDRTRVVIFETPTNPSMEANDPQQSWGFEGEPPEAVIKDSGTRDGTL
jgi:hypothetical protein